MMRGSIHRFRTLLTLGILAVSLAVSIAAPAAPATAALEGPTRLQEVATAGFEAPTPLQEPAAGAVEQAQTKAPRLQAELERIVGAFDGRVGVAVEHVESGVRAGVDVDTPYPMASTYKVPILVEVMARVAAGEWSLDDPIEVTPADQHLGSGLIQVLWAPGATLSLKNVATMMIILSDNSATDMLIDRVGAANVTERMRALGLEGIRVDRTTLELILDYLGVPYEEVAEAPLADIRAHLREHRADPAGAEEAEEAEEAREAAEEAYYRTPLDVATAADMTRLLAMIARGEATSPELDGVILEIMERTRTGSQRLPGLLPPGVELAHKTGTVGRVVNDVGVITLPDELGRVAISVFTLADEAEHDDSERTIAQLGRAAYDYFRFTVAERSTSTTSS